MTTHIIGSSVQLTHIGAATETPAKPLDGMDCPRCHGAGWVFVIKPLALGKTETVREVCQMCHGFGEPQDGHMDEGCVPVGSDYGPARGIQPPTKDLKGRTP